jgi:hypothetical protein
MTHLGQSYAFVDRRRIGRSAPIPAVRGPAMEPRKSTHLRHSYPRRQHRHDWEIGANATGATAEVRPDGGQSSTSRRLGGVNGGFNRCADVVRDLPLSKTPE